MAEMVAYAQFSVVIQNILIWNNIILKRLFQKYFFISFCHVERSETSRIPRIEILRYTQNDKEDNTLIV